MLIWIEIGKNSHTHTKGREMSLAEQAILWPITLLVMNLNHIHSIKIALKSQINPVMLKQQNCILKYIKAKYLDTCLKEKINVQ